MTFSLPSPSSSFEVFILANEDGVEKAQCALTIETFSFKDDNDYEYDIWLQVFSRILKL